MITRENGTPLAGGRQGLVAVGPFEYYAEYGRTHGFEELGRAIRGASSYDVNRSVWWARSCRGTSRSG